MVVNSFAFLLFVGVTAVLYYLVPFRFRYIFLLAAGYVFYFLAGVGNIGCLLLATIVTWGVTCLLETGKNKRSKRGQRAILVLGISVVLSVLLCVKVSSFIAPLGISYFSLQAIGYMLDVYKGKEKAQKNLLKTGLFLGYFPQITQGPIGRYKELSVQLFEEHEFDYEDLCFGAQRILIGFFKKTVIADRLKPFVNGIFANYTEYSGFTIALGCVYMTFQLYADFSAYSDIVCGVSRIFGIRLRENFKTPFFSTSLAEYWRRWHISLSSWFRDYVFYPLSISKPAVKFGKWARKHLPAQLAKLAPIVFAMSVVWMGTGLWHDVSVRYLIWGMANGGVMILSLCLEPVYAICRNKFHVCEESRFIRCFRVVRTFVIVCFLKVFAVSGSAAQAFALIRKICTDFTVSFSRKAVIPDWSVSSLLITGYGLLVFLLISVLEYKHKGIEEFQTYFSQKNKLVRWGAYLLLFVSILWAGEFGSEMVGGFEYAQY